MNQAAPGRGRRIVLGAALSLALAAPATVQQTSLARDLDRMLTAPEVAPGAWGVYVYSLDRQRVLFNHEGDRWFVPASNVKLFTAAAALERLGADYQFHTAVAAESGPDAAGLVTGDITLIGSGDPSLSGRAYPYRYEAHPPAPPYAADAAMRTLAAQMAARGVKRIAGDVIGDDSAWPPAAYPPGWAADDLVWGYGAPVSALAVNDNQRFLVITPGAVVGTAANLEVDGDPAGEPAPLNQVTTVAGAAAAHIQLRRDAGSGRLRVRGTIGATAAADVETAAVADPALFAAAELRTALLGAGIAVGGRTRAAHAAADSSAAYELAGLDSPPLAQIVQVTLKVSENLQAELLLRALGRSAAAGAAADGSRLAGLAAEAAFLRSAGLDGGDTALVDGSGLSRLDLATPAGTVRLLRYMSTRPEAAAWRAALPLAGRDGTLARRLTAAPAAGNIAAKTGSLTHVDCLSGYATAADGERLAFSIMVNNDAAPEPAIRAAIDRMAERMTAAP